MFYLLFAFVQFPDRKDSIFANPKIRENMQTKSSGSLGFFYSQKCHMTTPNSTISTEKTDEWCSSIEGTSGNSKPWISYYIPNKKMRIKGYSIRNGCCYHSCCCINDNSVVDNNAFYCCCRLYSFSLLGSNNNITWDVIHQVKQRKDFYYCRYETYDFDLTEPYTYLKITLDERYPDCPYCMTINEVDFYGDVLDNSFFGEIGEYSSNEDNEESISIIGKIKHN